MPEHTSPKTTKSGKTFVGLESIDVRILFPIVLAILRGGPAIQLAGVEGELSGWIEQLRDDPFKFLGCDFKKVDADPPITGNGFWAEFCRILIVPSKRSLVQNLARECIQPGELELLERALLLGEYETLQLSLGVIGNRCGMEKLSFMRLMCMARALETTVRCAAHYRLSIFSLIKEAEAGDEDAVLKLVALDKMFFHDKCTKEVIAQNTFRRDKNFEADLAQALKREIKPDKHGRTRFRFCLLTLFALKLVPKRSPRRLGRLLDPNGTTFKTTEASDKFIERCRNDFHRVDPGFTPD